MQTGSTPCSQPSKKRDKLFGKRSSFLACSITYCATVLGEASSDQSGCNGQAAGRSTQGLAGCNAVGHIQRVMPMHAALSLSVKDSVVHSQASKGALGSMASRGLTHGSGTWCGASAHTSMKHCQHGCGTRAEPDRGHALSSRSFNRCLA